MYITVLLVLDLSAVAQVIVVEPSVVDTGQSAMREARGFAAVQVQDQVQHCRARGYPLRHADTTDRSVVLTHFGRVQDHTLQATERQRCNYSSPPLSRSVAIRFMASARSVKAAQTKSRMRLLRSLCRRRASRSNRRKTSSGICHCTGSNDSSPDTRSWKIRSARMRSEKGLCFMGLG